MHLNSKNYITSDSAIAMALEDTVIVTEKRYKSLYTNHREPNFLRENGFLPLTVNSLTTKSGEALIHLANYAYLTGYVSQDFRTGISGKLEFLNHIKNYFRELGLSFRFEHRYDEGGTIVIAENGSMIGKLIYLMVIKFPQTNGENSYAPRLPRCFPYYMQGIANSNPDEGEKRAKKRLIRIILQDLIADRLKMGSKITPFLQLATHATESEARKYAGQVARFLNMAVGNDIFSQADVNVNYCPSMGLYACVIKLDEAQFKAVGRIGIS